MLHCMMEEREKERKGKERRKERELVSQLILRQVWFQEGVELFDGFPRTAIMCQYSR